MSLSHICVVSTNGYLVHLVSQHWLWAPSSFLSLTSEAFCHPWCEGKASLVITMWPGVTTYSSLQKDFLSIELVHGRVKVTIDLGSGPLALVTDQRYNNGTWYKIAFQRNRQQGKHSWMDWMLAALTRIEIFPKFVVFAYFSFLGVLKWYPHQKPLCSLEY